MTFKVEASVENILDEMFHDLMTAPLDLKEWQQQMRRLSLLEASEARRYEAGFEAGYEEGIWRVGEGV